LVSYCSLWNEGTWQLCDIRLGAGKPKPWLINKFRGMGSKLENSSLQMKLFSMLVVLIMIFNDVGVHGKCPPGKQWNPMAKKCIKYYFGS